MSFSFSQCWWCKHLDLERTKARRVHVCAAFPKGVPDPIALNVHDHRIPFEGDNGVQFDPLPDGKTWVEVMPEGFFDEWQRD